MRRHFNRERAVALYPLLQDLQRDLQLAFGTLMLDAQEFGYVDPETARQYVLRAESAVTRYADRAEELLRERGLLEETRDEDADPREPPVQAPSTLREVDVPRSRPDVPDALPNEGTGFYDV